MLLLSEGPLSRAVIDELGRVGSRGFVPGPYPSQLRRLWHCDTYHHVHDFV